MSERIPARKRRTTQNYREVNQRFIYGGGTEASRLTNTIDRNYNMNRQYKNSRSDSQPGSSPTPHK